MSPSKDDGPKEKRQRNRRIDFRLTEAEYAEVRRKANRAGYTVGAYVRATVLGSPGPRAQRLPPTNKVELVKLHHEINKIGNNLNQGQKAVNMGKLPPIAELKTAYKDVSDFRSWLRRALNLADDGDDLAGDGQ